jgi:hypothetical protein
MRIDKIRKKNTSNVIDLDISRFDLKFDNFDYPIDDKSWFIETETVSANINIVKLISNYKKQIQLMKDFKHFIKLQKMSVNEATLVCYFNTFKQFMDFINLSSIEVNRFSDIDYLVMEKYVEYLKTAQGGATKYRDLKNIFRKVAQTKGILVSEDLKNKNYVQIQLNKNTTARTHYTEVEFKDLSKTIVSVMEDYLSGDDCITESCFVMSSYWFIAICTGFNATGLMSLTRDSFEYFDDNKKILTIIGEKNRSSKGYQIANISFNNEDNNLLTRVINKLIDINLVNSVHVDSKSLFIHKQNYFNQYHVYKGAVKPLVKNKIYIKYSEVNNCIVKPSTAKIRNYRSLFLYDKSKNEKLVADMMNHRSIKTTIDHYIKQTIESKDNIGLFLVQNLLTSFVSNDSFDDWVTFQQHFDLKGSDQSIIVKNINDGVYNSPLGACIKNTDIKEPCTTYINCFKCRHYSVIGERDLWKILSFRECIIDYSKSNSEGDYSWILDSINSLLCNFEKSDLDKAKKQLKNGRHPFWKNEIMFKQIIADYEGNI